MTRIFDLFGRMPLATLLEAGCGSVERTRRSNQLERPSGFSSSSLMASSLSSSKFTEPTARRPRETCTLMHRGVVRAIFFFSDTSRACLAPNARSAQTRSSSASYARNDSGPRFLPPGCSIRIQFFSQHLKSFSPSGRRRDSLRKDTFFAPLLASLA